jgi:hypothetical protein
MQASSYLNKLPQKLAANDRLLIVDPMLATGKPPMAWQRMSLARTEQWKLPGRLISQHSAGTARLCLLCVFCS